MRGDSEEGSPQRVCYSPVDEIGFDPEEQKQRNRRRGQGLQVDWDTGIGGGRKDAGEDLCDRLGMVSEKKDHSMFPAIELGMILKAWIWRSRGVGLCIALGGLALGLAGGACWGWGLRQNIKSREGS